MVKDLGDDSDSLNGPNGNGRDDDDDMSTDDVDGDMGRKEAVVVVKAALQKSPHFQIYKISPPIFGDLTRPLNARNISILDEKYFHSQQEIPLSPRSKWYKSKMSVYGGISLRLTGTRKGQS